MLIEYILLCESHSISTLFLSHLMIPLLIYSRVFTHNHLITRTALVMIVDDATGLQVGVDRYCTHIFEAEFLQVLAYPLRQAVADRDRSDIVALVQDRLVARIRPDVFTEAAALFTHLLIAPGIVDNCLYFTRDRIIPSVFRMRSISLSS